MKKLLSAALALAVLFSVAAVNADNIADACEEPPFDYVGVHLTLQYDAPPISQTVVFDLRDADTNELISRSEVYISPESAPVIDIIFNTFPYEAGKSFIFHMSQGEGEITYNEATGAYFVIQTYSYPAPDGESLLYNSDFYMSFSPKEQKIVNFSLCSVPESSPLYAYPQGLLMPASALDKIGIETQAAADGGLLLTAGDRSLTLYMNELCAYKNAEAFNLTLAPQYIDQECFVPVGDVTAVFECPVDFSDDGQVMNLNIERSPLSQTADEKKLNGKGISSDTQYLIWVSKSEYTVRVYMGSKGNWRRINSFACAIGAPSSPTCEGIYKYYQYQSRWEYSAYYCGPIMRFNGGYAIHSTLLRYNGTDYDGRVGVRISHGCIRVRPENINWLANTVPLYSTVYITA